MARRFGTCRISSVDLAGRYSVAGFDYEFRNDGGAISILAGFLAEAWANLTGEKGELVSVNFYRLPTEERPNVYWFRIVNSEAENGVFVTLNRWGLVSGIQIDQTFSANGPQEVETVPISPDRLFVDGFRYNYPDIHITRRHGNWTITLPTEEFPLERAAAADQPHPRAR